MFVNHFMVFAWTILAVATILVVIRLYVQLRFYYRPWREFYLFIAWQLYVICTIIFTLLVAEFEKQDPVMAGDLEQISMELKYYWAQSVMWLLSLYACKALLLCLYSDLGPRHLFPRVWWWGIFPAWLLVAVGALYQFLISFLMCRPLDSIWDLRKYASSGNMCSNIGSAELNLPSLAMHFFTDIVVYTIPFFLLHSLKTLSWQTKAGAAGMFAAGLFNISAAGIQIGYAIFMASHPPGGFVWIKSTMRNDAVDHEAISDIAQAYLYASQQGTALIIVCLPQLRRLWLGTSPQIMKKEARTLHLNAGWAAPPQKNTTQALVGTTGSIPGVGLAGNNSNGGQHELEGENSEMGKVDTTVSKGSMV